MSRCVETVETLLPAAIALHPNLDAAEDDLLSALEVDTKLHDISIVDRERSALHTRTRQANVVQKSTRARFNVLDKPLAICTPELAVSPTHNL